ncbi:TetR family transcriptional regulator [Streptomyces sp. 2333.5]|uniref:TetR/AcrR family transcriptional regulator n=1 Tax=Streptomyces TaxID=1883 RepID=UPI000896360F|nr:MULTISPECIES: TetR/AcrR family transcriptional regulator [unclassified Streptomyces]PJJ06066.1 TetR family transcriptional regulator [Streptomyces sp. 2333.5]SEE89600.1 transcriptional regulator, TetR family [Streptomyces sp. 2314.4]SEF06494.1 transcriptional regulator, TetR family [Streptomyces sp. 2112.2]
MGVSRQKAAQNHDAIVDAAETLFRQRGAEAVGLVELMAAAGLTRGGFYNHFASKGALVDEVVVKAMTKGLANLTALLDASDERDTDPVDAQIDWYLSPEHRADIDHGCPNAGFLGDAPRLDDAARARYTTGLTANLHRFSQAIQDATSLDEEEAWSRTLALFSQMAGALLLSRAVAATDPELSDQLLSAARQDLHARAHHS